MLRTRKSTTPSFGIELNEYERVCVVPGTMTFMYWPGRNFSAASGASFTEKPTEDGDSFRTSPSSVLNDSALTLQTADEAAIRITQSDCTFIWQVRT